MWLYKEGGAGADSILPGEAPAWLKRLTFYSSQRWAGVSSIIGLPHVHMPQPCETKQNTATTNQNKLHWDLSAD